MSEDSVVRAGNIPGLGRAVGDPAVYIRGPVEYDEFNMRGRWLERGTHLLDRLS